MLDAMVIDGIDFSGDGDVVDPAGDALIRAAGGDRLAFAEFYDLLSPRVFGMILRVLVDRSQSEEVLQEVFLEAWQSASSFDPERGHARAWILTMAHRRAVDRVRTVQASRRRDLLVGTREQAVQPVLVEDEVEFLVDGSRAVQELAELPEAQRRVIVLAYFGGYSQSEISVLVGAPLGTVKTRIRDGLSKLRVALEEKR